MMTAEEKAQWLADRAGKLTASRMKDAMDYRKDGKAGSFRVKYLHELLAERLTGFSVNHFVNDAMQWGLDHEDEAVDCLVERYPQYEPVTSHFYDHPVIANFGATPDRELGYDGLLEVKCPTSTTFLGWVIGGVVPEEHKPQMCAQLLCTGRKWCGFVAYDPRIRDETKRLFLRKYTPTQDELDRVEKAAEVFLIELDNLFDAFVSSPVSQAALVAVGAR